MGTTLNSRIYGHAELDGTHRVIIESKCPELIREHGQTSAEPAFVHISKGDLSCACIVAEVQPSTEDVIRVDRFKQLSLKSSDGESVSLEFFTPVAARHVRLGVRSEFLTRDIARLIGKPLIRYETTAIFALAGEPRLVKILDTQPKGIVLAGPDTEFTTASGMDVGDEFPIAYEDIGGLRREIASIREQIEYPLKFPGIFDRLGIMPPKGVILYGPAGTGKTLIMRALVNEVGAKFYSINGPEVYSMAYGESERRLRKIFEEAAKNVPALILIDELDALAPKRDSSSGGTGEVERRVVATLLTLMDGITKQPGIVVVGTTNRLNAIDTALRRQGRFGQEIHIGVPDAASRESILRIHTRQMPMDTDVSLGSVAEASVGFVGADLAALCREAAYAAMRRTFSQQELPTLDPTRYDALKVGMRDFTTAMTHVQPSALKEFVVEIPMVLWREIGGLEDVKSLLIENLVYPLTKAAAFREAGVKPARGVLLYGPPGTGKTLLVKAVANECAVSFISIKGSELRSKWQGESAERIRSLFSKAREASPCLIFFDEIDAAAPSRRGHEYSSENDAMVNQLLCELDGIQNSDGIFVVGATNMPDLLDSALMRPGRLDYHIRISLPDSAARQAIFAVHLAGKPAIPDLDLVELATLSNEFSGADIAEVCRRSAMASLRESGFGERTIALRMNHLRSAIEEVRLSARAKV